MKDLNREIQSVQKIIHLLEHAHARGEKIIDLLPAIFCVIDDQGRIYRGNNFLGELMNSDFESLIHRSMSSIFSEASWSTFQKRMVEFLDSKRPSYQFELDLGQGKSDRSFLWNLLPLHHEFEGSINLTTVIAIDVSELKFTTQQKSRMEAELKTARAVQETLLPLSEATFKNGSLSGRYHSASECGGDIWYYTERNGKLIVCIADVMGHGASSALLASGTRAVIGVDEVLNFPTPARIMNQLNTTLCDLARQLSFMTAVVGILDLETGQFDYTYAAHEPFIHITTKEGSTDPVITYCTSGPSNHLGAHEQASFTVETLMLKPGDRLFLYTDGFFEMMDSQFNKMGPKRITNMLKKTLGTGGNVAETAAKLDQQVIEAKNRQPLDDDVTFFLLQYK